MTKRNSQNVRLREEVVEPIANYVRSRGMTQQHVVSVGAWLFMSMPETLRPHLGDAFLAWCESDPRPIEAGLPENCPDLLKRIFILIQQECRRHIDQQADESESRIRQTMKSADDLDVKAAQRALDGAEKALETNAPTGTTRASRKGRQTG